MWNNIFVNPPGGEPLSSLAGWWISQYMLRICACVCVWVALSHPLSRKSMNPVTPLWKACNSTPTSHPFLERVHLEDKTVKTANCSINLCILYRQHYSLPLSPTYAEIYLLEHLFPLKPAEHRLTVPTHLGQKQYLLWHSNESISSELFSLPAAGVCSSFGLIMKWFRGEDCRNTCRRSMCTKLSAKSWKDQVRKESFHFMMEQRNSCARLTTPCCSFWQNTEQPCLQ